MPRELEDQARLMRQLLQDAHYRNLHAQAHARHILDQLNTPVGEWPRFQSDLDERLIYSAHFMLVNGLDLVAERDHFDLARQLLTSGAEALEFVAGTSPSRMSVEDELLRAAIGYHVGGHHARSYVLCNELRDAEFSDPLAPAVLALVTRDLARLSSDVVSALSEESTSDAIVARALQEDQLDEYEGLRFLGHRSLLEALALFVEYVKRGDSNYCARARELSRSVAELGRAAGQVDLWWWGRAVERLIADLEESSLWRNVSDIGGGGSASPRVLRYIQGAHGAKPAIISLWPSQMKALDLIKAPNAPSFCVRMPTSAGKTKIAELAVLRALVEAEQDRPAKCLYIAPFRSLAVEVESTLRKGLRPAGITVSELYGGFDVSRYDARIIENTQVLVATPEKVDAVMRLAPELLDGVRLVIIDEGHIAGDTDERGLRAEVLFNRLLWRLGRDECRHILISAVLPNSDEFACWIGGNSEDLAASDWRPSRLAIGECEWNGNRIRIEFRNSDSDALPQPVFIPQFVETREVRGLEGVGRRRNPFPHNASEAFAASAIRFATQGVTLAFVPQARHVEPAAQSVYESLQIMRTLATRDGTHLAFAVPDPTTPLFVDALSVVREELGGESRIAQYLRAGIAIHHGNLPTRTRNVIEGLIRAGAIRLVVATTTLGQGVNLPVHTVLIRGLQQGLNSTVNPTTIWNIAGRAGRALRENEGRVLFFVDTTSSPIRVSRQRRHIANVIDRSAVEDVIGVLHRFLVLVRTLWERHASSLGFEDLCIKLAEDDFDWVDDEESRTNVHSLFELVDQHLLALSVEAGISPEDLDTLQQVLRDSLLFAQLDARPISDLDKERASTVLLARIDHLYRRIPTADARDRFYAMGFSLSDCEQVESIQASLLETFRRARTWEQEDAAWQLDLLLSVTELALTLSAPTSGITSVPTNLLGIVRAWLSGKSLRQMATQGLAAELGGDPGKLGRVIEQLCTYGLAWAITGFVDYARRVLRNAQEDVPPVLDYFPAMFKLGVASPLAAVLAPYLEGSRNLASLAARACPHSFRDLDQVFEWFRSLDHDALISAGIDREHADRILGRRDKYYGRTASVSREETIEVDLPLSHALAEHVAPGDPLLIRSLDDQAGRLDVLTLRGAMLAQAPPLVPVTWLENVHTIQATAVGVESSDREVRLRLRLSFTAA
jgi:hypothetical protein